MRSIQAAIDRLRASRPGEVLHAAAEFEHYDSIGAWSFDPVGRWAPSPPFSVLYQQRNPQGHSAAVLEDPKKLVNYANFGGAIATWNAHGTGRWAHAPGAWILVEVTLVQEQADDDFDDDGGSVVAVVFALWRVLEGWAAAVWRPRERELLAQMIGLGRWPTAGWQDCAVWYGE